MAYTVTNVDTAGDKSDTDVWMTSWDGTEHLRLTSSTENETAPRWSPDGRHLAFLSGRPGAAKGSQVWLLDRNGGEAQQLTDVKGRLNAYEWAPDSKRLLLTMADPDPSDDEGGRGGPAKAPKPIVIDRYKFKQDIQGYLTQPGTRLYIYDIASKKAEALTQAKLEATAGSWSPDGQRIAFVALAGKDAERYNTGNIFVIDAKAGAEPRQITNYDGLNASAGRFRPDWSPDGTKLVYLQSSGAKIGQYNMNRPAVVAVAGGEPRIPAEKLDRARFGPAFHARRLGDPVYGG